MMLNGQAYFRVGHGRPLRANILGDDRNAHCHPEGGGLFETSLFRDRFAEFIERFEVERQGLFNMLDGLFVGRIVHRVANARKFQDYSGVRGQIRSDLRRICG